MARRVYDTAHACVEEVTDIVELLRVHGVAYFETPAGLFGLSSGAIWITHDADYPRARRLIEHYDRARAERVRARYGKRTHLGSGMGAARALVDIWQRIVVRRAEVLAYTVLIVLLIVLHVLLFRELFR